MGMESTGAGKEDDLQRPLRQTCREVSALNVQCLLEHLETWLRSYAYGRVFDDTIVFPNQLYECASKRST